MCVPASIVKLGNFLNEVRRSTRSTAITALDTRSSAIFENGLNRAPLVRRPTTAGTHLQYGHRQPKCFLGHWAVKRLLIFEN